MDVVGSNLPSVHLGVSGFVQTCVQMASLPGEGNAPLHPGKVVILGNSRKRKAWQQFKQITSA